MTSAIALYASWIIAKNTLSDSGTFFNDDVKIACFTSLSDRLCQILWVPSWVFNVLMSWLISGDFEYIALINVWHLLLKSWHSSSSAVFISGILFISLDFMYLYAWNTSFPFASSRNLNQESCLALLITWKYSVLQFVNLFHCYWDWLSLL